MRDENKEVQRRKIGRCGKGKGGRREDGREKDPSTHKHNARWREVKTTSRMKECCVTYSLNNPPTRWNYAFGSCPNRDTLMRTVEVLLGTMNNMVVKCAFQSVRVCMFAQ